MERKKTPVEIREEYERLQREREERRLQQRTNPKVVKLLNVLCFSSSKIFLGENQVIIRSLGLCCPVKMSSCMMQQQKCSLFECRRCQSRHWLKL